MGMATHPFDWNSDTSGFTTAQVLWVSSSGTSASDSNFSEVPKSFRIPEFCRGWKMTKALKTGLLLPTYRLREALLAQKPRSWDAPRGHLPRGRGVSPQRSNRSLSPRARSTRRTRSRAGVFTVLRWSKPGKRMKVA